MCTPTKLRLYRVVRRLLGGRFEEHQEAHRRATLTALQELLQPGRTDDPRSSRF